MNFTMKVILLFCIITGSIALLTGLFYFPLGGFLELPLGAALIYLAVLHVRKPDKNLTFGALILSLSVAALAVSLLFPLGLGGIIWTLPGVVAGVIALTLKPSARGKPEVLGGRGHSHRVLFALLPAFVVLATTTISLQPDCQNPFSFLVWSSHAHEINGPSKCPATNQTSSPGNPRWLFRGACAIFDGETTPFLPNFLVNPHSQPMTVYLYRAEFTVLDFNSTHYKVLIDSATVQTNLNTIGNNRTEWFRRDQPMNPTLTMLPLVSTDIGHVTSMLGASPNGIQVTTYTYSYIFSVKSSISVSDEYGFPIGMYFSDTPAIADSILLFVVDTNFGMPSVDKL